jgi:hypothetical protein
MNVQPLIERLRANADGFQSQTRSVSADQARWKPAPDQWSILEVVNHLADEEVLDFRARLDSTLHRPAEAWPPIDPVQWAIERSYNERNLEESVARLLAERARSLDWLEALPAPDWQSTHEHPHLGPLRAGDLMTSWVAHDFIHVRQINRVHRQYLVGVLSDYHARYAGSW